MLVHDSIIPLDTGRKLNVHKTVNLRPVSRGIVFLLIFALKYTFIDDFYILKEGVIDWIFLLFKNILNIKGQ